MGTLALTQEAISEEKVITAYGLRKDSLCKWLRKW
jgi:hypothetical protein